MFDIPRKFVGCKWTETVFRSGRMKWKESEGGLIGLRRIDEWDHSNNNVASSQVEESGIEVKG